MEVEAELPCVLRSLYASGESPKLRSERCRCEGESDVGECPSVSCSRSGECEEGDWLPAGDALLAGDDAPLPSRDTGGLASCCNPCMLIPKP